MTLEQTLMAMAAATVKSVVGNLIEKTLNDVLAADPNAVGTLIEFRVPCDPKVETDTLAIPYQESKDAPLTLGVLGLLNAVVGLHGLRVVAHLCDNAKTTFKFTVEVINNGGPAIEGERRPELREAAAAAQEGGQGEPRQGP